MSTSPKPELTDLQRAAVLVVAERVAVASGAVAVHWNFCRCCVSVHEDVKHPLEGWIVNRRGEMFYEQMPHGNGA